MPIPPIAVQRLGQSIWTDNISRHLINSGELQRLIDHHGVLGLTSNPSIFQKAIGESDDYDDLIRDHVDEDAHQLYERLSIRDIRDAADILKPVYVRTGGVDGYVSLEVSPLLANSTEETAQEAVRLFQQVDRPNVMIKIPGTRASIPAIEEAIAQGVNVNVTLLFNVRNYESVAEAYIRGLERRLEAGGDITNVTSVASFFISRIDVRIDKMLENNIRAAQGRDLDRVANNRKVLGKAGIANAKLAYQSFQRIFEGKRFAALRDAGATVQRPLWASTSTKNPAYPDTYYVDNLIGKYTVNTLPPATLEAFSDHGTAEVTLTERVSDARDVMDMLAECGIDFEQITHQLQEDGVEAFIDSFEMMIDQVHAKRAVIKTGIIGRQKIALGIYREKVERALDQVEKDFVNGRIWSRDATVWKDHPTVMAEISNRLGWLDVQTTINRDALQQLQAGIKDGPFKHVVMLGMGSGTLAPEVFARTFGPQPGYPELMVLDSTDPAQIEIVRDAIEPDKTLFLVSSKSGNTIETLALFHYFWQFTGEKGEQFIAITDEDTTLQQLAQERGFRDVFINPSDVGTRYSALTYTGMVPAAVMGLDLERLWASADDMFEAVGDLIPVQLHPGMWLGIVIGKMAQEKRDKLMIFASEGIRSFGEWVEQLVAESTGKENRGIVPIAGATIGKPHDYGSDRTFVYIKLEGDPSNDEMDEGIRMLREAGHPRVTLMLPDKYALAGEFLRWEYATSVAGHLLKINPFDEPNIAEVKQKTNDLLGVYQAEGHFPIREPFMQADGVELYINEAALAPLTELCAAHGFDSNVLTDLIAAQILGTNAGDYFAFLAYAPNISDVEDKLEEIRRRVRHLTRRATATGYGPRYLHGVGQLHKGGPDCGVIVQLTHADPDDIEIPGAGYSFGVLKAAQAAGDMNALYDHRRRGLRVHAANGDIQTALDAVLTALDSVERRRQ